MGLQMMLDDEADRLADSTMHTFNNVLTILARGQKLRAARHLLRHVRDCVERLEREVQPNGSPDSRISTAVHQSDK